jgi:hypothetical protein
LLFLAGFLVVWVLFDLYDIYDNKKKGKRMKEKYVICFLISMLIFIGIVSVLDLQFEIQEKLWGETCFLEKTIWK